MAKIKLAIDITKMGPDDPQFTLYVGRLLSQVVDTINGRISLSDNCDATFVSATIKQANVEQGIPHSLNRVPQGYFVVGSQAATQVYNGSTTWTTNAIYVKATVATQCNLLIF